jgi:hypothetical protein
MGMKWGAKVHYANSKDESVANVTKKNSAFGLGLGASRGDFEGYLNLDLSDKSEGAFVAGDLWKRKPGMQLGGSYKFSGMTFFADYTSTSEEITAATGSDITKVINSNVTIAANSTVTHKTSEMTFGAARIHEVSPAARIVADARLVLGTDEVGGSSATAFNGKAKSTKLPVTFALEADATSWLVLRGSVSQNVILGSDKNIAGKTTTKKDSAIVNAGATLNFGKLKVDGVVGTTGADRNGAAGTGVGAKEGVLATDNLMTRVGLTYNF